MTDGIATPIVGLAMDKFSICGSRYGRRKSWHLFGTLLVSLSFAFIYTPAPGHSPRPDAWSMIYLVSHIHDESS